MDELDRKTEGTTPPDEEDFVRRLLEAAGPRPPILQEDLDAISSAAELAWRRQVRSRAGAAARRPLPALAAGLAAALAVALGLAWWMATRTDRVPPAVARVEVVAGPVHLETEGGGLRTLAAGEPVPPGALLRSGDRQGRASLRLTDGTTVRVDVGTRLRFASAAALELERGALYADTGSGTLEVRTPVGTARDVGTRFTVRLEGPESAVLVVRVRDGAVLTEQRGRTYRTAAGGELTLRRDGTSERREVPPYGPAWEWVLEASAGFDIEGRSLQEFLDWVSRETGWRIVFADAGLAESAARIELHGSLGGLRPDRAPFAVLPGAGLEGELRDGTLVVRAPR